MKKLVIILILLLPLYSVGQKIESGYRFTYTTKEGYKVGEQIFNQGHYSFLWQIRAHWKGFGIISNSTVYMDRLKWNFRPNNSMFDIMAYYKLNKWRISVGHRCCHPLKADRERGRLGLYGGYKIKFGISYNIK